MTRYKNIKSNAQFNLFANTENEEQEVVADFEVKPAKAPSQQQPKKVEKEHDSGFDKLKPLANQKAFRFPIRAPYPCTAFRNRRR